MDTCLLRTYQRQVLFCCKAVLLGYQDIAVGLQDDSTSTDRAWYGVQSFIIGAGNLSETLWGGGSRQDRARRYAERQPLPTSAARTPTRKAPSGRRPLVSQPIAAKHDAKRPDQERQVVSDEMPAAPPATGFEIRQIETGARFRPALLHL